MEKDIKDYLKFYIGCDTRIFFNGADMGVISELTHKLLEFDWFKFKPILRRLESMTEEEGNEIWKLAEFADEFENEVRVKILRAVFKSEKVDYNISFKQAVVITKYLLSKHFDLFGLIDSGIAIEQKP